MEKKMMKTVMSKRQTSMKSFVFLIRSGHLLPKGSICLSATVANPDELAGWIGEIHGKTELVTSSKRPVPLTWYFSTKHSLLPLLDERGTSVTRKLSLNYLQLSASEARFRDDDDGYRKRR